MRKEADLLDLAEMGGAGFRVDLHGLDVRGALDAAESALQSAFMRGERTVEIVHGRGEGVLRRELGRFLAGHPLVERFREAGSAGRGGSVTYVELAAGMPGSRPRGRRA